MESLLSDSGAVPWQLSCPYMGKIYATFVEMMSTLPCSSVNTLLVNVCATSSISHSGSLLCAVLAQPTPHLFMGPETSLYNTYPPALGLVDVCLAKHIGYCRHPWHLIGADNWCSQLSPVFLSKTCKSSMSPQLLPSPTVSLLTIVEGTFEARATAGDTHLHF